MNQRMLNLALSWLNLAFVRYVHSGKLKEELLFCAALKGTTKTSSILTVVSTFFETNNPSWNNPSGVCTDRTPVIIGSKSGFQAFGKVMVQP